MRDQVLKLYANTLEEAKKLVADVPCERFSETPHEGAKHPGWVLGHLCLASGMGAAFLDGETESVSDVPTEWMGPCMDVPTAERGAFGNKGDLIAHLERVHGIFADRFASASDADLAAALPKEDYREFWPTQMDGAVYLMGYHEGYHLGQLSAWRRAAGFGPAS